MPISLPAGLVIDKSIGPILVDDNQLGAAILRSADSTVWWSVDFRVPSGTPPEDGAVTWGPFASRAAARAELELAVQLDQDGTDGTSAWLVLPE